MIVANSQITADTVIHHAEVIADLIIIHSAEIHIQLQRLGRHTILRVELLLIHPADDIKQILRRNEPPLIPRQLHADVIRRGNIIVALVRHHPGIRRDDPQHVRQLRCGNIMLKSRLRQHHVQVILRQKIRNAEPTAVGRFTLRAFFIVQRHHRRRRTAVDNTEAQHRNQRIHNPLDQQGEQLFPKNMQRKPHGQDRMLPCALSCLLPGRPCAPLPLPHVFAPLPVIQAFSAEDRAYSFNVCAVI